MAGPSSSNQESNNDEPEDKEGRGDPDPQELLDRVEENAKRKNREVMREVRKHAMRIGLYEVGKDGFNEIVKVLKDLI